MIVLGIAVNQGVKAKILPLAAVCSTMRNILTQFRCPKTGADVQALLTSAKDPEKTGHRNYEVTCPACSRLHFIDRETRKLVVDKDE